MYTLNVLRIVLLPLAATAVCWAQDMREAQTRFRLSRSFIQESIFRTPLRDQTIKDVAADIPGPTFSTFDDFTEDVPYAGIATFAHLNATNCFAREADRSFDIGIVGAPFDLGVTYRPGERFGPAGTRMGSRRLAPSMAYRYVHVVKLHS